MRRLRLAACNMQKGLAHCNQVAVCGVFICIQESEDRGLKARLDLIWEDATLERSTQIGYNRHVSTWNSTKKFYHPAHGPPGKHIAIALQATLVLPQTCCSWQGGALFTHAINIRPPQCITPPSDCASQMLELQIFAGQAAFAFQLPLCEISIEIS